MVLPATAAYLGGDPEAEAVGDVRHARAKFKVDCYVERRELVFTLVALRRAKAKRVKVVDLKGRDAKAYGVYVGHV